MIASLVLSLVACKNEKDGAPAAGGPPAGPPPQVGVITIKPELVTLTKELPGRTSSFRVAEVRARVNGIVQKRMFTEGADVKEGQPLFRIDPAPYQATLESAQAQLARADANATAARSLSERYTKLVESNAISRQEYDDAMSRVKAAQADIAAARAAVKTARISVDYTLVTSPITGRIGRAEVTEGAYVQQASATLLATVQQLDRMYVDFTWSTADFLRVKRAIESGELKTVDGAAKVTIVLEDGRDYPVPGALQFADVSVDPTTGSIALRAIVPNPKGDLLPGMFVRTRIEEGTSAQAILVPQRAVTRDPKGGAFALVVDKAGKVERRPLVTDRAVGNAWLVTEGLAAGDQVIVEGLQRARPGGTVSPVPFTGGAPATTASGPAAPPPQASSAAPVASPAPAAAAASTGSGR